MENTAVVIDNGSTTIKAGFSGFDSPSCFTHPHYAISAASSAQTPNILDEPTHHQYLYHNEVDHYTPHKTVHSAIAHGLITDFDQMEHIWSNTFYQLATAPSHQPVLLSEPIYNTKARRGKTMEIFFETFSTPQFAFAYDVVLNLFSTGKPSGLVCDIGGQHTTISAISDGNAILSSAKYTKVAGESVDTLLYNLIQQAHDIKHIPVHYQVDRRGNNLAYNPTTLSTPSFYNYILRKLLHDIKLHCVTIPLTPFNPTTAKDIDIQYVLPDGQIIHVGELGCVVGESFFQPTFRLGDEIVTDLHEKHTFQALPVDIFSCIQSTDVDLRTTLLSNIVLCGGSSLYSGLSHRVQLELNSLFPAGFKIDISTPLTNLHRHYATFLGGAILSSLSSFNSSWIYKADYEEHGNNIVLRII